MRNPVGGAERKVKTDSVDDQACGVPAPQDALAADGRDVADYLLDTLTSARRLAAAQGYRFLAYLLGLASEEARQLAEKGESWSTSWRDRSSGNDGLQE